MSFRLLVDIEVLEIALKLDRTRQRKLFRHFLAIQTFPRNYSDFTEFDAQGRLLNISLFEDFQIRYWIDDADRHIKILHLEQK